MPSDALADALTKVIPRPVMNRLVKSDGGLYVRTAPIALRNRLDRPVEEAGFDMLPEEFKDPDAKLHIGNLAIVRAHQRLGTERVDGVACRLDLASPQHGHLLAQLVHGAHNLVLREPLIFSASLIPAEGSQSAKHHLLSKSLPARESAAQAHLKINAKESYVSGNPKVYNRSKPL